MILASLSQKVDASTPEQFKKGVRCLEFTYGKRKVETIALGTSWESSDSDVREIIHTLEAIPFAGDLKIYVRETDDFAPMLKIFSDLKAASVDPMEHWYHPAKHGKVPRAV